MNARSSCVFFVCKKQQYQGEIAVVTNLRPLMSAQLLKLGSILYYLNGEYIYQIFINNLKQFLQKILTILCQVK